jgi:hypothetical protein
MSSDDFDPVVVLMAWRAVHGGGAWLESFNADRPALGLDRVEPTEAVR